jgi:hypothetical protein
MIYINHDKKAIFIHIPKTGGSYIGPTLTKYYGFISYLSLLASRRPDHDKVCKTLYLRRISTGNSLYDNSLFNKILGVLTYCKTSEYFNKEMNMNEEKWNTYIKFCFIRNPYSRAVSGWKHFNTILNRNISIFEYLNVRDPINNISDIEYGHIFMSQLRQIQDENGLCGVDLIGRFEHLENDFRIILNYIGFNNIIHPIKRVNVSNTDNNDNVQLEIRTIKKINELFFDDFEIFHYQMIGL